jgi:TonB family protein
MPGAFEYIDERLPASERRTHLRQRVRTLAYVELDEGNGGIVLNVSEGGLSVQAVTRVREESLSRMRFQLSQSNDWLETGARVAWTSESGKVAGLQFTNPREDTRSRIREWLAGEVTETVRARADESPEPATTDARKDASGAFRKESAADGVMPAAPAAPAPGSAKTVPAPSTPRPSFGQSSLFQIQTNAQPLTSAPPDTKRSDRAWNLAGLVALLAVASLGAGWIAGRGTLSGPWESLRGTAMSVKTPQPNPTPISGGSTAPISQIEVVDVHNRRWTIPFDPAAAGVQTNYGGQRQSVKWPTFHSATTTPEIQPRDSSPDTRSLRPNPPEVAPPSDSGAGISLPSGSADARDLRPPVSQPEPKATETAPAAVLHRGALIYHVDPVYPELARQQGVEGTVRLLVTIGVTGTVRGVIAVSGPGLLIEAARSAVRQWRYTPSLLDGKPVESQEYVSIVFQQSSR